MRLSASYVVAALAIYAASLYLIYRLRPFITASSMLVGFLLLVHGPVYLEYMLFRGQDSTIFRRIAQSLDFDRIVSSLNLSIAGMFLGVMLGIELVDRLAPRSTKALERILQIWNEQLVAPVTKKPWLLFVVILVLSVFMARISLAEHHIAVVAGYLSVTKNEVAKIAYRQQHGGSQVYFYRLVLGSISPMLVVWGALAGWHCRWWPLIVVTILLFAMTVLGRIETLSKAPIALFAIQLLLVIYLAFRNSISWRELLVGLLVAGVIFYPIIRLAVPEVDAAGAFEFFYYRAFDISNEALLEFFGAFPGHVSYMWGGNIRPFAAIMGLDYSPSFDVVSRIWRGTGGSTTTAMFIADAWADFSYVGVVGFSVIAGVICRSIDVVFLTKGKTVMAIAVLGSAFMGVFSLMISALPTAMLSGGLVLPPLLALAMWHTQDIVSCPRRIRAWMQV